MFVAEIIKTELEKKLSIIEMIIEAEKREMRAERYLHTYDSENDFSIIRLFSKRKELEENLQTKQAVVKRLENYYICQKKC